MHKHTTDKSKDGLGSIPAGKRLICTPTVKLKNGRVIQAAAYGKKAFCFYVDA